MDSPTRMSALPGGCAYFSASEIFAATFSASFVEPSVVKWTSPGLVNMVGGNVLLVV